ncbi:MAG TPA: RND family transporter, partial [Bacteroidetes bacterium]|nr:RND family transporter [Bacteroidota bacterium]
LRNRLLIIIAVGLVTLFMGYNISSLKFYFAPTPLLPENDSLLLQQRTFNTIFGKGENLMIIGVKDSTFFERQKFELWLALEDSIRAIDGVEHVFSVSDIFALGKDTENKVFTFDKVFKREWTTQNELDSLKSIALSLPFYNQLLYNKDENVYLMMISIKYEVISSKGRVEFMDNLMDKAETYQKATGNELRYSGLPYIRTTVGELIESEMYMFIALAIAITAILIFLLFRSFRIVLFSMLVVATSVVWGLGLMALMGYQITLLTAVIPPLIIVIGVPNCIYLINKYHHEYSIHGNKVKALQRVIQKIGSATFLTNLTTAAGFGTFMFTGIAILKEFGLIAAIDIMGVFLISILLIPTIFSFLPPPEPRHLQHLESLRLKNVITRVITTTLYRRRMVFTIAIALVVLGVFGLLKVESKGYMVDDIPKNHPAYIDLKFFEKNFSGVMPLEIVINTKKPKGVMQEATLNRINRLQNKLTEYDELSRPLSIAEAAKFARQGYYNGNPSQYKLPSGFERGFVMAYLPKQMGNNELLGRFVDTTASVTRIIYNVADVGSIRISEIKQSIRAEVDSIFGNQSNHVTIAGGSIISAKGNDYLVRSLFISLLAAIGIISLFMAGMFKKPRMVFLSILPNLIPLLLTAAAMGYWGISLKPSTVIVFSIAFGISVDNSIHFLAKYRQELIRTNNNSKASVICAIRETGVSMIYTSVVLFFGFGIFMASKFGGTVSLGLLVSLTLLVALFSNLILLPSILLKIGRGNSMESECIDT